MADSKTTQNNSAIHVLHVDDDKSFLEISKLILNDMKSNYIIESALSVDEALAKLATNAYDVIVSDYEMPNKNGLDLLKELKKQKKEIPFILFTGKGREEVTIQALNLGANYYINKQGSPETVYGELVHGIKTAYAYKKAESLILETDSRYRELFDTTPNGIVVYEAVDNGDDFIIKDVNPTAEQIEKIAKNQIVGRRVTEAFPGVKDLGLFSIFQQVWKTGKSQYMPDSLYKDTNEVRSWRENWVYKLPNNELVAIYRDITGQKKAELSIKESEEKFSKSFKYSPYAVTITRLSDGKIIEANESVKTVLGFVPEEIIGKTTFELGIWRNSDDRKDFANLLIKQGSVEGKEIILVKNDKSKVIVVVSASLFKIENEQCFISTFIDVTENRKAQEAIKNSETRFRNLYENTLDAVLLTVPDSGSIISANPAAQRMLNMTEDEIRVAGRTGIVVIDDRSLKAIEERKRTGRAEAELTFKRKDGSTFEGETTSSLFTDSTGEIRSSMIIRNISQRKKAEESLKESLNNYQSLINGMSETAWVIDFVGNFLEVNDAAVNVLGFSKEELLSIGIKGIDKYLSREQVQKLICNLPSDKKQVFETVHTTKNGTNIPVEISSSLIMYRGKQAILSIARNISERKKTEAALRESEEKMRNLLTASSDGITIVDPSGVILECNIATAKLHGFESKEEIIGKNVFEFVAKKDHERALEAMSAPGPIKNLEFTFLTKDGGEFPVEVSGNDVLDASGKPTYYMTIVREITERKKAEEALKESEERFSRLSSAAFEGIAITEKGKILDANNQFAKMFGYELNELIDMKVTDFVAPESLDIVRDNIQKGFEGPYEHLALKKDGSTFPVEIRAKSIQYQGHLARVSAIQDITQRKKDEELIKKSESRYRELVETLPAPIFEIDNQGTVIFANSEAFTLTGYSREDFDKGFSVFDLVPKKEWEKTKKNIKRSLTGVDSGNNEYTFVRKDRTEFPAIVNAVPIMRENGSIILRGVVTDITQRKKTEEEMKVFYNLFELATDSISATDLEGNLIYFNDAACKMRGYTREEMAKLNLLDLNAPETAILIKSRLQETVDTGTAAFESVNLRKDKTKIFLDVRSRLLDINGRKLVVSITRDVTERKEAEEKIAMINEKLRVVGKLTRHDVRNKLSNIRANSYLLRKKLGSDPKLIMCIDNIDSGVESVDRLFDLSSLYEQIGVEEPAVMDVKKCFDEAVALIPNSGHVQVFNESEGLAVKADSLLRSVFYNLIDNSLKHGLKVSQVRLHFTKQDDQTKLIYEDDGVGITENNKRRLFTEGFSTSNGTGLGLSMLRKILQVYDWTITEEGESGKGAKFVITIPNISKLS